MQDGPPQSQSWAWQLPVAVTFAVFRVAIVRFPSALLKADADRNGGGKPSGDRRGDDDGPPATFT
jgi:hypothetical protein